MGWQGQQGNGRAISNLPALALGSLAEVETPTEKRAEESQVQTDAYVDSRPR